MVSAKAKYALRASTALAAHHGKGLLSSADVAEKQQIPPRFCENIVGDLKKNGLLHSEKGREGGYRLARAPETISMADVLRAIDGPIAPAECVSADAVPVCKECPGEQACRLRGVFARARAAVLAVYESVSLADLAGETDADVAA